MRNPWSVVFVLVVTLGLSSCTLAGKLGLEKSKSSLPSPPAEKAPSASEPPVRLVESARPAGAEAPSPEKTLQAESPASTAAPPSQEGEPFLPPFEGPPSTPSKPPKAPERPADVVKGKPQYVSLNFENADLELVLRSIADITGINFIIGPGVKAAVTMRTTTKVPSSEVFSIMESVLEVNNLVAVKDGLYYRIVPIAVAQQEPQDVQVGKERGEERERYVTQIVRLDYLSAEEMARILQTFLGRGAKLVVHKETNSLIIAGFSSTVRRLLDTVKALDVETKRDNIQRIFVYFVENVQATQLANILNTLYGRRDLTPSVTTLTAPGARPGQPPGRTGFTATRTETGPPRLTPPPALGQAAQPGAALPPGVEPAPGEIVGEVTIVPDEGTNALIIKTSPRNYEFIEATIKKLDIVPKQVVIELFLAQIRLSDTFQFSLEEIIRTGQFLVAGAYGVAPLATAIAGVVESGKAPATGLTFAFVDKDKFRVVLNNIAAVTKVEVLANPHLLTANNKEAKIQIGQEVPIITGSQTTAALSEGGTTTPFQTIQQKDIGIIMGIKPHVNEKRLVTLDIESENIAVDQANFGGTGSASFLKTTAKTSVVVEDGQTLLIGGIIRTDKSKGYRGIPFLSQIPLLGYLFRATSDVLERNELVILVTPHVIASPEEGRAITQQFRGRVESLEPLLLKSKPQPPPRQP